MKYFLLLFITMLFLNFESMAQVAKISGEITDKHSKEAIAFASVQVFQDSEVLGVATTDLDGMFRFKLAPGTYSLVVSYIGVQSVKRSISLKEGDSLYLRLNLELKAEMLESVETIKLNRALIPIRSTSKSMAPAAYDGMIISPHEASDKGFSEKSGQLTAGQLNDFRKWDLWKDLQDGALKEHKTRWRIRHFERFSLVVVNEKSKPVIDATVQLYDNNQRLIWVSKTDNTGQAELWNGMFADKAEVASITILAEAELFEVKRPIPFEIGINYVRIPVSCVSHETVDVAFVVDATGSMGDEINFLKSELKDVLERFKTEHPSIKLRTGSVFYRDRSDEYLVRKTDLSDDINETIRFIAVQRPNGGGDYPEAMDEALITALDELNWSENARSRMLFVMADAPPHQNSEDIARMHRAMILAAKKGIRIIPVTASGVNKSMEFLMRAMALSSNGTYTFLTDHSGTGNAHIEPTVDQYDVEKLNELMLRLMDEYSFMPACNEKLPKRKDTLRFRLPNIITTEILNELWMVQYNDSQVVYYDTTSFLPIKSPVLVNGDSLNKVKLPDESVLISMQIFPNPSADYVQYAINGYAEEILLLNLSGKLLQKIPLKGSRRGKIDLRALPSGMYLLVAINREQKITGKIQKI